MKLRHIINFLFILASLPVVIGWEIIRTVCEYAVEKLREKQYNRAVK